MKFQDYFFKALAQKAINNFSIAIQNLEKCNEIKPNDSAILFELSKNYLQLEKFFEAEQYAKQALKLTQDNYWVLQHLSSIYLASSDIKSAIEVEEKLVKVNPKKQEKLLFLYFQNNQIERVKKLILVLEEAGSLSSELSSLKRQIFKKKEKKVSKKSDNLKEMIAEFESEKSFETLRKIVTLSTISNKQLLLYTNKGLELFPAQAFVYLMNAKALNRNTSYNTALERLLIGIDYVVDNNNLAADFYEEIAKSYLELGDKKEAIKNKNKALALRNK
ncbi:MAG: hypothetical protein P8H13_07410 [Polaribacter sp.]|nr:hypothetical protein [Polaribacter sp.]MDG1811748.1 hypothetical protein [Polaribacter sp.]MDG1994707.1 hypothetical protein [Polaribacter sp.]